METDEIGGEAFALEHHKRDLERNIEVLIQEYEADHSGPVELDLSFVEGEGSGPAPEELKPRVQSIVEAFHRKSLIDKGGIRVHKVTAIDSDGDGSVAVRVQYDYPDYQDEE